MDELVTMVAQKTGIPAEQARKAVDTVLEFLKERLPAPIASQIDSVVSGGGIGGIARGLGGMMGGPK